MYNSFFKALNDETRRGIMDRLRDRDLSAGEIAGNFNMSKPSISHHLDLLKQAGLVNSYRNGQYIIYSLNATVIDEVIKWFMNMKKS